MKKKIAGLLAFCMLVQVFFSSSSNMLFAQDASYTGDASYTSDATQPDQNEPEQLEDNVKGSLQLHVITGSAMQKESTFTISMTGKATAKQYYKEFVVNPQDETIHVTLEDIVADTYAVTITGVGYRDYVQTVEVKDNYISRLRLYTTNGPLTKDEVLHPGILALESYKDRMYDEVDINNLLDEATNVANTTEYDQDKNGVVDLVDLQWAAEKYQQEVVYEQQYAAVESYVANDVLQPATSEEVEIIGNVEDILVDEGSIVIQRSDESVISQENPVAIDFNVSHTVDPVVIGGMVIASPQESENQIQEATILVTYEEDGEEKQKEIAVGQRRMWFRSAGSAQVNSDGSIVVDFGGQIAVKKVTLKITGTKGNGSLAEISKVEFVNDMENRIPEPDMNIPSDLRVVSVGSNTFTVSWSRETNVTGYEVAVEADGVIEKHQTTGTQMTITTFKQEKLENYKTYTVKVQSINGEWSSGYSETVTATPKPESKPDAPDNVSATGNYRSINVSWKKMKDTVSYNVYYRKEADQTFQKVENITSNSYTIEGLEDNVTYIVYVTGVNELGEGPGSLEAAATTTVITRTNLPSYKLINESNGEGVVTSHIVDAKRSDNYGYMVDSELEEERLDAFGIVDDNFGSYYQINDWDEAVHYHKWQWGLRVTLDQAYEMDRFTVGVPTENIKLTGAAVYYYNAENKEVEASVSSFIERRDDNGKRYYVIKLASPITTDRVRIGLTTPNIYKIAVSELRFYHYDSLEADVQNLYDDNLHLRLREGVDEATIDALQERLDTQDHGEYHPERANLQKELDAARQLLADSSQLDDVITVNTNITTNADGHFGITGLNAWQPLGKSVYAGEELIVYVGKNNTASGANTNLQLVAAQQHAEAGTPAKVIANLKTGRNIIVVPELTTTNVEKGGALYIQYTGNNGNDQYGVRISGGVDIPVLNLYGIKDSAQRLALAKEYVTQLQSYVATLEATHEEVHAGSSLDSVHYDYDPKLCVLNTTDLMLDQMMISVPASQVLAGINASDVDTMAQKLVDSMDAMDQMMTLFYQHKGMTNSFEEDTTTEERSRNTLPSKHLNIRYAKMFAGAFMYASGNHIGIEWDQTVNPVQGVKAEVDEDGHKLSGSLFGWGIAHEIGHNINQSQYAIAEVTNNYFAQLITVEDTGVRFSYEVVYDRVTSGIMGRSGDVFLQLAMYWQLHLAYDNDFALKTYSGFNEIQENLFFARVDRYARTPSNAPAPNGVALSLSGDKDQILMRLASAAAEKDLQEFFLRWGLEADASTKAYMEQFPKEERALYYVNDTAHAYRKANPDVNISNQDIVNASVVDASTSQIELSLDTSWSNKEDILGYEIARLTYEKGQLKETVVGFTTEATYIDQASSMSNRTITYKVTAIDKTLHRSASQELAPIKVVGDGYQEKDDWSVRMSTNALVSTDDEEHAADEQDPCEPVKTPATYKMIDGDEETIYHGRSERGDAEFILDLGTSTAVTSIRYHGQNEANAIENYEIAISDNNQDYTVIAEGTFEFDENGEAVKYFDNGEDPWIVTYNARYVKITAKGQSEIAVGEIDIYGPSGDNVEFTEAEDGTNGIGILAEDFVYQEASETQEELKIPAGSIVFTGKYKGNPAYNVVVLYDEAGNMIVGSDEEANQIILAPDPGNAMLGETSEGTWVYWIDADASLPNSVRAELYRVDNALTNEGERLVSDSLMVEIPESLPQIHLEK